MCCVAGVTARSGSSNIMCCVAGGCLQAVRTKMCRNAIGAARTPLTAVAAACLVGCYDHISLQDPSPDVAAAATATAAAAALIDLPAAAAAAADEMVMLGGNVAGWPRLTLLLKLFLVGLVPYTCLEVTALQVPFIFQLAHILIKLFFVCHNRSVQQMVQLAQQPYFGQPTKQLLDGWVEFLGQSNWSVLLRHDSISGRSCDMTLLFILFSVTTSMLMLWSCYLFSLTDMLQWLKQNEEKAMCNSRAAARHDDEEQVDPGSASLVIGSVWVTAQQLAAARDSAFIDTLLSVHPSGPVVTLVVHIVVLGCICCGSCVLSQLLVLQLLPRFGSNATLDLYCPKIIG
jgi:hypothetical protein